MIVQRFARDMLIYNEIREHTVHMTFGSKYIDLRGKLDTSIHMICGIQWWGKVH